MNTIRKKPIIENLVTTGIVIGGVLVTTGLAYLLAAGGFALSEKEYKEFNGKTVYFSKPTGIFSTLKYSKSIFKDNESITIEQFDNSNPLNSKYYSYGDENNDGTIDFFFADLKHEQYFVFKEDFHKYPDLVQKAQKNFDEMKAELKPYIKE